MELKLNGYVNERETVYYILGIMVFLSSFYISVNLLVVNLVVSLILFNILIIASSIYILNVEKYSLFKHDMIFFQGMFCSFSMIYLINALRYVMQEQYNGFATGLIIGAVLLLSVNFIILTFKQKLLRIQRGAYVVFLLVLYTYFAFVIILSFAWIYISETKSSLNNYINSNFKISQSQDKLKAVDFSCSPENYLSYDKMRNTDVYTSNEFDQKKLKAYINMRFAPVNKLEDFILYSAENCFEGINVGITAEGAKTKYELVVQKFLFVLITLVTIANLSRRGESSDNWSTENG